MFSFRKKFHLVIVCTANRTRSAYFAGYLKHYLEQYRSGALKRIKITSAGTKAASGERHTFAWQSTSTLSDSSPEITWRPPPRRLDCTRTTHEGGRSNSAGGRT